MTGRVRDFTREIFGELDDTFGRDFVDTNTDGWWDKVENFFTRDREKIGNEVGEIERYLKRVCEKNNITREMLRNIFEAVHGIEGAYAGKMSKMVALLRAYREILVRFKDTLQYFVVNATGVLDMSTLKDNIQDLVDTLQEHRIAIDKQYEKELEEALKRFVKDDGTYNWNEIEKAMSEDADIITEAVLVALSLVYLSMQTPEDINRFMYLGYDLGIPEYLMTDDGSVRVLYTDARMTEVFQRIAAIAEQVAVTTALIYYDQYGELSEEVESMLRNAEMASYAVAYASEKGGWLVVTRPGGDVLIESGPFIALTDKSGHLSFYVDGPIAFSFSSQYIGLDDYDEFINRYVSEHGVGTGAVIGKVASDVALSTAIAVALAFTLPESLPIIIEIGIGAATDTVQSTFSEVLDAIAQNESLSNLVRTSAAMVAYGLLGAEVFKIIGPNSKDWYFGANLHTVRNIIYTYGYINSELASEYGLSQGELEAIVQNGNPKNSYWKPIKPSRLSEDEQRTIYEQYSNFIKSDDGYEAYRDKLNSAIKNPYCPIDKKTVSECSPEEVKRLIVFYNEHPEILEDFDYE